MTAWYDNPYPYPGSRGYPSYWSVGRDAYGYWTSKGGNPWRAWRSVYRHRQAFFGPTEEEPLAYFEDNRPVRSWAQWHLREKRMDNKLRKILEQLQRAKQVREADRGALGKAYPLLLEFLCSTEGLDKKTPREPGTLFVYVQDGTFKGCLGERMPKASLWAAADTLEGLLKAFDAALASDNPDWRVETQSGRYSRKKGKG